MLSQPVPGLSLKYYTWPAKNGLAYFNIDYTTAMKCFKTLATRFCS